MALTKQQVQDRIDKKFPHKGLKLLTYEGMQWPAKIQCPVHGEQHVSSAGNLLNSAHGCPLCGKESSRAKRTARLSTDVDQLYLRISKLEHLLISHGIELPEELPDAQPTSYDVG